MAKILTLFILALTLISAPAMANDLFNNIKERAEKKPVMRSASWNTPKPKKEETVEAAESTTKEVLEDTVGKAEKTEKEEEAVELTPDQKLWKKYKDLAAGIDKDKEAEVTKNTKEDEKQEASATIKEEQGNPVGIAAIIADYKNAQKNKGKMNSRSFGKLD